MTELSLHEVERAETVARLEAIQAIQGDMGWRWFIAEIEREIEVLQQQIMLETEPNAIGRLQGRYEAFNQVRYFEDTVDAMLANQREDSNADV